MSGKAAAAVYDVGQINILLDTSTFDYDYYRFLKADAQAVNMYTGEYMAQYSWAEFMVGYLDGKVQQHRFPQRW